MIYSTRLRSLFIGGALAAAIALGVMQPARATLTSLTVSLSDPDNFPGFGLPSILVDAVPVIVPGKEIEAGNATNIGGAQVDGAALLLANEYVDARPTADDAAGNRIVLGLEAGAADQTGYGPNAFYAFSNFDFATPSIVTGVSVSPVNIAGLGALNAPGSQISFTGGVLKVFVGNLHITDNLPECGPGVLCGTITLDLNVQAVPEPSGFVLLGAGLIIAVLAGGMRRGS
jgi:hypothetical protein